jgi:hypothetical protein
MRIRASRATVAAFSAALALFPSLALAQPAKLLISQLEVRGSAGSATQNEYIVIKNPGSVAVDLSNYYITDATFSNGNQYYYNLPDPERPVGGGGFNDFVARFPDGASIPAGGEVTVSINGSESFENVYGVSPHFELFEDGVVADAIPDMTPARPGSIVDNVAQLPTFSNSGEVAILFYWDGESDLVTDIDYLVWGDKAEGVDKTGESVDGPDPDTDASTYNPDTSVPGQDALSGGENPTGTYIRIDDGEGTQSSSGGNGVDGRDETSENLSTTFSADTDGVPPGQQPEDTTPPVLLSAAGSTGNSNVDLLFSEGVFTGAGTASNYAVYPTASPGSPIPVVSAETGGEPSTVTLNLGSALAASTAYTVEVSNVQDAAGNTIAPMSTAAFTTGAEPGEFGVAGVFRFGPRHIGVAFTERVTSAAASTGNYTTSLASGATGGVLQDNGQTVILTFAADLPPSTEVSVTVNGAVQSAGGASLGSDRTLSFTTGSQTVIGIDQIHADIGSLTDQTVTIVGQIYMPVTVQGSQISGYIQDGTGRGLNLFDFTTTVPPAVAEVGKVVRVTGTVELFFTTVELTGLTVTELATDQPHLGPRVLSVGEAASAQWEGTYIQTTSTLTSAPVPSGASNYNAEAQGITFRIRNNTGINFNEFDSGDEVTGAGAGAAFQSTYQITVGNAEDFFKGGGGPDTTPPALVAASGADASSQITLTFSETVATGATVASNYSVTPGIAVNSASVNGSRVTLNLGSPLEGGTFYTVTVSNVQDAAGNTIAPGSTISFTATGGGGTGDFAVTALFQFGPRHIGVSFGKRFNLGQAGETSHYTVTPLGGAPAITVSSVTTQANRQTAILVTQSDLPQSATYQVAVSGITGETGESLAAPAATNFTTVAQEVIGIDQIHANIASLTDETVTIVGQVYMPMTPQGGQISGYIQDGTGRGVNLFDFTTTVPANLNSYNKVIRVTGTVELFFTTVELTGLSTTLLAADVPRLAPRVLSVAEANSPAWEGTYIQTTAELSGPGAPSGANNYNFTASGDGATITFRVRTNTGINFSMFGTGDRVTAAGAGAAFQTTFQITVGNADEFRIAGTGPPTLLGASGSAGESTVRIGFSEELEEASAENASNYSVFPVGNPAAGLGVNQARLDDDDATVVNLSLASPLALDVTYAVQVSNVRDLQNEVIEANSLVTFTAKEPPLLKGRVTIPPVTLVKNLVGAGEVIPITVEGEVGSRAVVRIYDLQGRPVRILADTQFTADPSGQGPPSIDLTWDARDETFELVPAGMYICHVATTDLDGKLTEDQAPIVVSVRLD